MRRLQVAAFAVALLVTGTAIGATWTRGDLPFEPVYGVAAHPRSPAIAFAVMKSGVYRTTDAGLHWQRVSDHVLVSFAFNPFRNLEVCAQDVSYPYDAACSVDLGLTWSSVPGPGLFFDPSVPDRVYGLPGYGTAWVYVSNDHGKTWKLHGPTEGQPYLHTQGASDLASTLYESAFVHGPAQRNYLRPLYRSRDGGDTWEPIPIASVTYPWEPAGPPNQWILATDHSRRSTLYFACGSLYASNDGGTMWETRGHVQGAVESLAADPANSAILYVGGQSGSVTQSLDGGWSWLRIDGGQIHQSPPAIDSYGTDVVYEISVGADGTVYAATTDAVFAARIVGRRHAAGRR